MNYRSSAITFAALATLSFASACSDDPDTKSAGTSTSTATSSEQGSTTRARTTTTRTTTATQATAAEVADYDELQAAIAPLGLDCSRETAALFCYDGGDNWQLRIAVNGDGDRAFRDSACDAGLIRPGKQVITNGTTLAVYAGNDGQDLGPFAEALGDVGIGDLEVIDYC